MKYRSPWLLSLLLTFVNLPPSPRIFYKNHEILGFETYSLNNPYYFSEGQGYRQEDTESL